MRKNKKFRKARALSVPIFVFLVQIGITLWTNFNENDAKWIADHFITPVFGVPIPFYVLLLILWPAVWAAIDYHNNVVDEKDDEIVNELSKMIRLSKKFSSYEQRGMLQDIMRNFVQSQTYVHAVQLYRYDIKNVAELTKIKVEYEDGFIYEGIDLNAMGQVYFQVDKKMYNAFLKAKKQVDHGDVRSMLAFIRIYHKGLAAVTSIPTDHESIRFAFVELALNILETKFQIRKVQYLTPSQMTIFEESKRTGILRAVLLKDNYYMFEHMANGLKSGRVYIARHMKLWGSNYVSLITLHEDILKEDDQLYNKLEDIDENFSAEIRQLLYNKDNSYSKGENFDEN